MVDHNFVRDRHGYRIEDTTIVVGLEDIPKTRNRGVSSRGAIPSNRLRKVLAEYFLADVDSVP